MGTFFGYIFAIAAILFAIFIILGMCGAFGDPNTLQSNANMQKQTRRLTANQIKAYMPNMDKAMANTYRKAIKNGQTSFNVGRGLILQWEGKGESGDLDAYFDNLECETKRMQKEGKKWSRQNQIVSSGRLSGMELEKSGDLDGAIDAYKESIEEGIRQPKTTIYNYAHSIDRLAVLYRKTKQIDEEIELLATMIKKHPKYEGKSKWKERLEKAQMINSKV